MANIETSFSIQDSLYEQATALADELHLSHNELFAIALEGYLRRYRNRQLQQSVDEAYADGLDDEEQAMLEGMRRHQQRLMEYKA